ncbi:ribosome maturation protein SDO1 [Nematocida displodere]|uniref:Ribosome maturation protein SDO1 n=1 Tax=Nematocida displodere TaxID=1805483 RepID=A0A177EHU8_9MICR|nr:ribosome maturation protein SDO1 [Nematocida displodere]
MVFAPETKKMDNVTVLTYKGKSKTYEIAAIPNKLYEYKRNRSLSVDAVVQSRSIFSDLSRGELAKREDLEKEFGESREEAIRKILDKGVKKRDKAAREYEQENLRKAVKEGVLKRLRTGTGQKLTPEQAEELFKLAQYAPSTKPAKAQVSDLAKKAVRLGYQRKVIRMKVQTEGALWPEAGVPAEGSFFTFLTPTLIEATDDLYGHIHRIAEENQIILEDLPEPEDLPEDI